MMVRHAGTGDGEGGWVEICTLCLMPHASCPCVLVARTPGTRLQLHAHVYSWPAPQAHDCSFRVVFTPSSGEPLVIQELDRHPETDGPVTGQYTVETPGRIQLVWDNSHSWMRSKTVTYHLQPDDLPCEVHAI